MKTFDLNEAVSQCYGAFPSADRRPVIGITGNYGEQTCKLGQGYYKQIEAAGGVPVIIPPSADRQVIINALSRIDALLLSGGADINPLYCGEEPDVRLGGINSERDMPELLITRLAANRQMPILGICRGIQTLAVALEGKVMQDITSCATIKHSQDADRSEPTHSVSIIKDSTLYNIYSQHSSLYVNSFHHQAVSEPGPHLRTVATAPDGIIEAVESSEYKSIIGVQWHPECMGEDGLPLFQWLVSEARLFSEVKRTHHHTITLDTHCDTPMLFPQGINFATRDSRILVDLHKMTEGMLDATIMVAYLPQEFSKANTSLSPKAYADHIFDKIDEIVASNSDYLAVARTPDDLLRHKLQGKKSIMRGIENGLALEGKIENIAHFAKRGIVYITLCHNGRQRHLRLCTKHYYTWWRERLRCPRYCRDEPPWYHGRPQSCSRIKFLRCPAVEHPTHRMQSQLLSCPVRPSAQPYRRPDAGPCPERRRLSDNPLPGFPAPR